MVEGLENIRGGFNEGGYKTCKSAKDAQATEANE